MPIFLELFHGRKSPTEQLDDWGSPGPILGPLSYVHTTYAADIKLATHDGHQGNLRLGGPDNDLLFYDGIYYGDWSVFGEEIIAKNPELTQRVQQFNVAKG